MGSYIIRRILLLIPTILFITLIIFLLVRWIPGDAIDIIESRIQETEGSVDRAEIERMLGLDVPVHTQYLRWIGGIITRGDFGNSLFSGDPVINRVLERMPVTLELGLLALTISMLISLPLGIFSAIRQDGIADHFLRGTAILMMAVPAFWTGTLVMIYPSIWWGWSPPMELIPFHEDPLGNLGMFILPALIMGASHSGATMRMVRTMMLEVMRQDYIRTAVSKGLGGKTVIIRHAVKNAFIPVITIVGHSVAVLIGGTVIIEQIFNMPGVGSLTIQALTERDYPLVSVITLITSIFVVLVNFLVDIAYSWLDPRIRYS